MMKAVLWDFGGVILSSPSDAFNRYETERGLPRNFLRTVNSTNPHTNAWARCGPRWLAWIARSHRGVVQLPRRPLPTSLAFLVGELAAD